MVFVDRSLTDEVLAGLPAGDAKLAFVLARSQGMRRVEIFHLHYDHIDWHRGRIEISEDGKTGWRECPIFTETWPHLLEAAERVPAGGKRLLQSFRSVESMTPIVRSHIVAAIGEGRIWPDILQQLRRTRRTELQETFPDHVLDEWLGHDTKTARDHYLSVTAEHWERAIGGNGAANPRASTPIPKGKTPANPAIEWPRLPGINEQIPPRRVELLFLD